MGFHCFLSMKHNFLLILKLILIIQNNMNRFYLKKWNITNKVLFDYSLTPTCSQTSLFPVSSTGQVRFLLLFSNIYTSS